MTTCSRRPRVMALLLAAMLAIGGGCSDIGPIVLDAEFDAAADQGIDPERQPDLGPADQRADRGDATLTDASLTDLSPPDSGFPGTCANVSSCTKDNWCRVRMLNADTFYGAQATAANDVWVVGGDGIAAHFDGTTWSYADTGAGNDLKAVWAASASDVFAVGVAGAVVHHDGAKWSTMAKAPSSMNAVWGTSASNVYAVGNGAAFIHYDGKAWSKVVTGQSMAIYDDIWGTGPSNIWVVGSEVPGYGGVILHFDGTTWSKVPGINTGSYSGLLSIWGSSANNIYVGGFKGRVLHYNGKSWTSSNPVSGDIRSLSGTGPSDIWAVTGGYNKVYHYNGKAWSQQTTGNKIWIYGATGVKGGPAYLVGHNEFDALVIRRSGTSWVEALKGTHIDLAAVWGTSASNVYAVGQNKWGARGRVLRFDGKAWSTALYTTTSAPLLAVWGSGPGNIFFVGKLNATQGVAYHTDGTTWTQLASVGAGLADIWGASANQLYLAGHYLEYVHNPPPYPPKVINNSVTLQKNGKAWQGIPNMMTTEAPLRGVWGSGSGDVYAVGGGVGYTPSRLVWHHDGSAWKQLSPPGSAPLLDVWGSGPKDVYMLDGANVLHYNGSVWTTSSTGLSNLKAIWGASASDVYVVGDNGVIAKKTGATWTVQQSGVNANLQGIWGPNAADLWAVGGKALLRRCTP